VTNTREKVKMEEAEFVVLRTGSAPVGEIGADRQRQCARDHDLWEGC
jgi:hypothetical protein